METPTGTPCESYTPADGEEAIRGAERIVAFCAGHLLLVLADSPLPFWERTTVYTPRDCGIAVDVLPYTRTELDRLVEEGNPFVREAQATGVVLFKRHGGEAP